MNAEILNYRTLSYFHQIENKGILDKQNLSDKVTVHLKKVTYADGGEDEEINLFAWHLTKDGTEYLVPMQNRDLSMKKLDDTLPLRVKGIPPIVAHNSKVYHLLDTTNYTVVKYEPEKLMGFRELVDDLSNIPHQQPKLKKLYNIFALASYLGVAHFRVSTPPGFGKDSMIDTIGMLMGDASTIENPTLAKFEREINVNKQVALNETTKIAKVDWNQIQMILLACAAQKPSIKKRSRAFGGVGEDIDLTELSLLLMYNDITDYDDPEVYFDFVTDKNVIDRFPAFRFYGKIAHDFSKDDDKDFGRIARENQVRLRAYIKTLLYYKSNWYKETHNYKYNITGFSNRWTLNISRLLRYVDIYCESQEEFDEYVKLMLTCMKDYEQMLKYPYLVELCKEKDEDAFKDCINFINSKNSFIDKNEALRSFMSGESVRKSESLNKW